MSPMVVARMAVIALGGIRHALVFLALFRVASYAGSW